MKYYLDQAELPEKWRAVKFADLKGSDDYQAQIEKIKNWDYETPNCLFINGPSGNGKTHLKVCLLKKYINSVILSAIEKYEDDFSVYDYKFNNYFLKESELFAKIYKSYDTKGYDEADVIEQLSNLPMLFLDDLFSSRTNDNARRVMLDLIDTRIDWNGKPTVISSNLSLKQIAEQIDTRIASRLSSGLVINLKSEKDYRIKKSVQ